MTANRPLKAAGVPATQALTAAAIEMRRIVAAPTGKGAVSIALTAAMPEPGTSPPVLYRIPGRPAGHVADLAASPVPERLDPVRAFLHHLGPATPAQVAGYLDAATDDVEARWPADVREVDVDGSRRELLVPDGARRADLWRTLGRPGTVLAGTEIVGTWRPRASARLAAHRGLTLTEDDR